MTYIRKISSKGFKSFAHKTDLEFGKSYNMILGPNGCGKSNVVDAICFVLGKTSAKSMRAAKSSNLIYNGGKKKNPAKEAEVSIEFDNSLKKFPVDDPIVEVTRILKSNGTSTYKVNNKVLTRQQVVDLLNAAHIDPDGHNIILQGDVIGFIDSKPVEKRQTIEEIAGISIYEEKKGKCLRELEKVDAKLHETNIILTEREAHLRELKKDRDQALKYKELEQTILNDKFTITSIHIHDKQDQVSKISAQHTEIEGKISKTQDDINDVKKDISVLKAQIKEINDEIEVKGEKEQLVLRRAIDDLKTTLVKTSTRLENCHSEISKIKERKKQLECNRKDLDGKISLLEKEGNDVQKQVAQLYAEEEKIEAQIQTFKKQHGVDDDLGKSFDALEQEIEDKTLALNIIQTKKQELLRSKDQHTFNLAHIEEKINMLEGKGKKQEFQELKSKKKRFTDAQQELEELFSNETRISRELSGLRQQYLLKNNEYSRIKARQLHIKEKAHSDLAVRKIVELKNQLKGIHGTVAELGKVDSQYSLALETAAGSRIHSLVVDSDIIAQKCIEYLKKNRLGTATFLPLNKIKSRPIESSAKTASKNCHGLALELVHFDSSYRDIFSFVLGSTLIVEHIDAARKIGIGNARMVTLEGDLLESSGAMVGGYRNRSTGLGFIEKELDTSVDELESEIEMLKTTIDKTEQEKIMVEERINTLRKEKAHLEADVITLEKTFNVHGHNIESLLSEQKEIMQKISSLEKEARDFDAQIQQGTEALQSLKDRKQIMKQKINDPQLTNALDHLKNNKMSIKEKKIGFEGRVETITAQIKTMLLPEKERTDKILKEQDKDFVLFTTEIQDLDLLIKERRKELKEKEETEKKLYSNFKDLIAKRNKFGDKAQQRETSLVREEEKMHSFEQKLHSISLDRAKAIAELEGLQKELEMYSGGTFKQRQNVDELKSRVKENEKTLAKIGNINLRALEVYEDIEREYHSVLDKVATLKSEKEDILGLINEVELKKKAVFMDTYTKITSKFKTIFDSLSSKGEAYVELENPDNPFDGGIDIQIKLTGSKFMDLKSLSGGEKSLAALSFIFAIQEHNPSPFYLLDEVDAALDKRNAEILSKLIQKYAGNSQYIVVSHKDALITDADHIYGITMQEGISKVVSLKSE